MVFDINSIPDIRTQELKKIFSDVNFNDLEAVTSLGENLVVASRGSRNHNLFIKLAMAVINRIRRMMW